MKYFILFLFSMSLFAKGIICQTTPSKSKFYKEKRVSQIVEYEYTKYRVKPSKTVKEFNEHGELIVKTLRLSNASDSIYEMDITIYEYDSMSNVTRIFRKKNSLKTLWITELKIFYYAYDSVIQKLKVKEWSRVGEDIRDTLICHYSYDSEGNNILISRHRLDGFLLDQRKFEFDSLNRLIKKSRILNSNDFPKRHTIFKYDNKNNVVSRIKYRNTDTEGIENLSYNRKGNLRKVTNRNGDLKVKYRYNNKGLPKKVIYPTFYRKFEYLFYD